MAYLNKADTMTLNGNDGARYQLAKHGTFNVQPFGPCLTLDQAQRYQKEMSLANVHVLVVRLQAL